MIIDKLPKDKLIDLLTSLTIIDQSGKYTTTIVGILTKVEWIVPNKGVFLQFSSINATHLKKLIQHYKQDNITTDLLNSTRLHYYTKNSSFKLGDKVEITVLLDTFHSNELAVFDCKKV